MEIVNVINVKKAVDLLDQSKTSSDENFLLNIFSEITKVEKTSINIPALKSKLYRYKSILKTKRGLQKQEFEREIFSLPVCTTAPERGKIYSEEIASYQETCESLTQDLSEMKELSEQKI